MKECEKILKKLGITMEFEFVPYSKSRNKDSGYPCLNWLVDVFRNGKKIMPKIDYSAGCALCPSYRPFHALDRDTLMTMECEDGRSRGENFGEMIVPESYHVMDSILLDASSFEMTFDEWAEDFGFDSDSRSAEKIYRGCIATAAIVRKEFSRDEIKELIDVFGR
jgi:hypothetical protein